MNGKWVVLPEQIYDFFNYVTYEIAALMQVLETKQSEVLAACCFDVVNQLVTHIKKKGEKVFLYYDKSSGWV